MRIPSTAQRGNRIAQEVSRGSLYCSAPDKGAGLDLEDRRALLMFLRSLTDERYEQRLPIYEAVASALLERRYSRCQFSKLLENIGLPHSATWRGLNTTLNWAPSGMLPGEKIRQRLVLLL